jgi:DNA-binding NarL/FixJ family response regulator
VGSADGEERGAERAGEAMQLAALHYFEDRLEDARDALEDAYRGFRAAGRVCEAARAAMVVAELHSGSFGNQAVAQGWLARARRLLERAGHCVDWGWYELALIACDRPDVIDLERSAARALEIAAEFGDSDLEVRALADGGLALVSQGRVREGFGWLDEAMAAIVAGEVTDPAVVGTSFCAMLSSCERTGDVRRAEEWMRVVSEQLLEPMNGRPRVLHTHCRLAYGSVLTTAGRWPEAEAELLEAIGPAGSRSLGHREEACARLAELRLYQGHVDEAAELLSPHESSLAACGPLAQLHLRRGEPDHAVAAARRGLRVLVGDLTRIAPLLSIVVEAEIERGDVAAAEAAATELAALVAEEPTTALLAELELAIGRVAAARDEHRDAITALERAVRHAEADARPLASSRIRLQLAESLAATGDLASAVGEGRLALDGFERLGAVAHIDRARALLRRLGAPAARSAPRAVRLGTLTARESEVLHLLTEGLTNAEIGARLYISAKTAEHHVGRILTKLGVRTRAEAAALAATAALDAGK